MTVQKNSDVSRWMPVGTQDGLAAMHPTGLIDRSTQRFQNIQGLRALAALTVFTFHAFGHYEATGGRSSWFRSISAYAVPQ
jgi:hypothetical protein